MHHMPFVLFMVVMSLVASSCRAAEVPSDVAVDITPSRLSRTTANETDMVEPTGVVTLRDAVALALVNNPGLKAFPYEMRAAEARVLQARLRPNPELAVQLEEFAGSGELSGLDAAETTVRLGQRIELSGKRAKRTHLASLGKELVRWDYESKRLDVIHAVAQAFVEVLAAQDRLDLAEKTLELSRQARSAVAQRVEAGKDSPVDGLRAEVVLSQSRIAVHKATTALTAARHRLAATWGSRAPSFEKAAGDFYEVARPMEWDRAASLIFDNPDVASFKTREDQRRAALRLEKAKATSDVTIAGGVRRFEATDDGAFLVGVALPIPLFDRNQGGIQEATANLATTRQECEAAQIRTLAALSEAINRIFAAYDGVTLLRDEVLPKAEQAFEAAREGYREGKFDYLYVLDTQRTLFETQAQFVEAAEAYHAARADVERLTGQPSLATDTPAVPRLSAGESKEEISDED